MKVLLTDECKECKLPAMVTYTKPNTGTIEKYCTTHLQERNAPKVKLPKSEYKLRLLREFGLIPQGV